MFSAHIPDSVAMQISDAETDVLRTRRVPRLISATRHTDNSLPSDLTLTEMQPSRRRRVKRLIIHALRFHALRYSVDQLLFLQVVEMAVLDIGTPHEVPGWFLSKDFEYYADRLGLEPNYVVRLLKAAHIPVSVSDSNSMWPSNKFAPREQLQLFPLDSVHDMHHHDKGISA